MAGRRQFSLLAAVSVFCSGVLGIACSGSDDAKAPPLACSADANAAGLGEGQVCADSGFRVERDDFSFANWGGAASGTEQLNAGTFIDLYGAAQVCATGTTAEDCALTPVAQQTLDQQNQALGGGRCEGLATLSLRYYLGLDDRTAVEAGVASTSELQRPQPALDGSIAFWWATQFAPEVQQAAAASREKDPATLVAELGKGLAEGAGYTIGIYGDGFGHAVTPFAVTKRGADYIVHVYDNNVPGERREIVVDPAANTWTYAGAAVNPDGSPSTWSGSTGTFELTPMQARTAPFSSPFGSSAEAVLGSVTVRLAVDQQPGDPAAGLLVTTESGDQFGIVDGELQSDIEGASYTVGKGGMGTAMVEVTIPALDEDFAVYPVAATAEASSQPVQATLSLTSADGTGTFVRSEVPLVPATPDTDPADLGTGLAVAPTGDVTVDAAGAVEVSVATNAGQFDATLAAGEQLVTSSQDGSSTIEVVSATGEVLQTSSVARVDDPDPTTSAPSTDDSTAIEPTPIIPPTTASPTTTTVVPETGTTSTVLLPEPPTSTTTTLAPPTTSTPTTSTTTTSTTIPSTTTTTTSTTTTIPSTTTTSTTTTSTTTTSTTTTSTIPSTTTTSTTTTSTIPSTTTTSTTTTTTLPPGPTCTGTGPWTVEYFNNMTLTGTPVLCRYEATPRHDWNDSSPVPGVVDVNNFSIRYTSSINVATAAGEDWTFSIRSDDGGRILVDGVEVVGSWTERVSAETYTSTVPLGFGPHAVVIEYYKATFRAQLSVSLLGPPPVCQAGATWQAQYWDNSDLSGSPAVCRGEAQADLVHFWDWPDPNAVTIETLPAEVTPTSFSARYTTTIWSGGGEWNFIITGDDGALLIVDGAIVLGGWSPTSQGPWPLVLAAGYHTVVVEYTRYAVDGTAYVQLGVIPPPAVVPLRRS